MEQTLGKRIAENRKRLKLTQDQLAEQLGITAQAVSKWENDQSCPDITMLPRLSAIFGITVDELLGSQQTETVYEAEVVEDRADDDHDINVQVDTGRHDGKWEFHWDGGKRSAVCFALLMLLAGILLFGAKIFQLDVSFWGVLWPCALLMIGLTHLAKRFSVFHLALSLFGAYSLVDNMGIWELELAEDLVFPVMVVFFGLGLLIDALKKPNRPIFRVTHKGGNTKKTKCACSNGHDSFQCDLSFGEQTHPVALPVLRSGEASVSFGELTVDLTGCAAVSDNCCLSANCSFGEITFLVPRKFRVNATENTAFAGFSVSGHPDPEPEGIIHLDANVSFGEVCVKYI